MTLSRLTRLASLAACALYWPLLAYAAPKPCVPADQAARMLKKDVCVSAHIYEVVQLPDGTCFLDVCPPQTPDVQCRFTIVSLWQDHDDVGELNQYRNQDVQIRGIVQPMHGRAFMNTKDQEPAPK